MRYLTITEEGTFLGLSGSLLQVKHNKKIISELPLSRLRLVAVARRGVTLSSSLVLACALRGIRIFFLDWRGRAVAMLGGSHQHATVAVRQNQFRFTETGPVPALAATIIIGKLRNQRSVLLYFSKYLSKSSNSESEELKKAARQILIHINRLKSVDWCRHSSWRSEIMGIEGASATLYWKSISLARLFPPSFTGRQGRNASEITNQMLNYGYTLLTSLVWSALDNTGLEPFSGILHQNSPGRPSLVLDLMEIFRPWVVDRNVIKLRKKADKASQLDHSLKRLLAAAIHETVEKKLPWRNKRLRLDTIIQRQAYQLSGAIAGGKNFKPYSFKW